MDDSRNHGIVSVQQRVVEPSTADGTAERSHVGGTQGLAADGDGGVGAASVKKDLVGRVASGLGLGALLAGYLAVSVSIAIGRKISTSAERSHVVARSASSIVVGMRNSGVVAGCHHGHSADGVPLSIWAGGVAAAVLVGVSSSLKHLYGRRAVGVLIQDDEAVIVTADVGSSVMALSVGAEPAQAQYGSAFGTELTTVGFDESAIVLELLSGAEVGIGQADLTSFSGGGWWCLVGGGRRRARLLR